MCLLAGVLACNERSIRCVAGSHRRPDNPLRRDGRLGVLGGVEYAAQAVALHEALCSAATGRAGPRLGYLANLRRLAWWTDRLDLLPGPLAVEAERLHGEADRMIYEFALRHDDRLLLEGRAAVVLAATLA